MPFIKNKKSFHLPYFRSSTPVLISKSPRAPPVSISPQDQSQWEASVYISPQNNSNWKLKTKLVSFLVSLVCFAFIAYFGLIFLIIFSWFTIFLSVYYLFCLLFYSLSQAHPPIHMRAHTHFHFLIFICFYFFIFYINIILISNFEFQATKTSLQLKVVQKCFCMYFVKR